MKQIITISLLALFIATIVSAQCKVNVYAKNNNEVPKIIEKLESLPAIEKAEKEQGFANYILYVKKGKEQSYKEIVGMWNDPPANLIRVDGRIKVVMNDTYAGKFDDAIFNKFKKDKNKVKSVELVDKGVFIVEFKEPGVSANALKTNYFGRNVRPRPNPMTFESLFTDIYFLPSE